MEYFYHLKITTVIYHCVSLYLILEFSFSFDCVFILLRSASHFIEIHDSYQISFKLEAILVLIYMLYCDKETCFHPARPDMNVNWPCPWIVSLYLIKVVRDLNQAIVNLGLFVRQNQNNWWFKWRTFCIHSNIYPTLANIAHLLTHGVSYQQYSSAALSHNANLVFVERLLSDFVPFKHLSCQIRIIKSIM